MNSKYKIENNRIIINNTEIYMNYDIKTVKYLDNKIFILLDIPKGIKLTEKENCNIFSYDDHGEFLWQVSPSLPKEIKSTDLIPYIDIDIQDEKLYGFDFWGRKFHIDINNGKLLDFKVFR